MYTLRDEIAKVAYELYEKRGRREGCHFDDWLEAERIVIARHAVAAESQGKPLKATRRQKEKGTETSVKVSSKKKITGKKTPSKKTV